MRIDKAENVVAGQVSEKGASGVRMRILMSDKDGAPNFIIRVFEIEPGGYTPQHAHGWEHEVYVLEGRGSVRHKGKDNPIEQGSFALVPPGEEHQFVNTGETPLKFICVIPVPGIKG